MSRTVEVGHIYAPDTALELLPTCNPYETTLDFSPADERTQKLAAMAHNIGGSVLVLVDDVAAREWQRKSAWGAGRITKRISNTVESIRLAYQPDAIAFENDFVERGRAMVEEIRAAHLPAGASLSSDENRVIFKVGGRRVRVPLVGFGGVEDLEHPSCPVLDLAWMEHRLRRANDAITILPQQFVGQQQQTELLASLSPSLRDRKVSTVFIDEQANVAGYHRWQPRV